MPTVMITGANRGYGLALARRYVERDNVRVIAVYRPKPEVPEVLATLAAQHRGRFQPVAVDLANQIALNGLPARLSQRIDVLINCAGSVVEVTPSPRGRTITPSIRMGTVCPLLVASAMLSNMTRGSKIAVVSAVESGAGASGDPARASRADDNCLIRDLARDIRPLGIAVAIFHPESPPPGATEAEAEMCADLAAEGIVAVVDGLDVARSGEVFSLAPLPEALRRSGTHS